MTLLIRDKSRLHGGFCLEMPADPASENVLRADSEASARVALPPGFMAHVAPEEEVLRELAFRTESELAVVVNAEFSPARTLAAYDRAFKSTGIVHPGAFGINANKLFGSMRLLSLDSEREARADAERDGGAAVILNAEAMTVSVRVIVSGNAGPRDAAKRRCIPDRSPAAVGSGLRPEALIPPGFHSKRNASRVVLLLREILSLYFIREVVPANLRIGKEPALARRLPGRIGTEGPPSHIGIRLEARDVRVHIVGPVGPAAQKPHGCATIGRIPGKNVAAEVCGKHMALILQLPGSVVHPAPASALNEPEGRRLPFSRQKIDIRLLADMRVEAEVEGALIHEGKRGARAVFRRHELARRHGRRAAVRKGADQVVAGTVVRLHQTVVIVARLDGFGELELKRGSFAQLNNVNACDSAIQGSIEEIKVQAASAGCSSGDDKFAACRRIL